MATVVASKSKPVAKTSEIHLVGIPAARLEGVVDRTAMLSDELLKSFETGERAAIDAVGKFVITAEEASAEVTKRITESGLEMADRLIHTEYDLLREVVASTGKSLSRHDPAKTVAA